MASGNYLVWAVCGVGLGTYLSFSTYCLYQTCWGKQNELAGGLDLAGSRSSCVPLPLGGAPQGTSLLGYILAATDCLICTGQDGLCASAWCLTGAGPSDPPALKLSNLHSSKMSLCNVWQPTSHVKILLSSVLLAACPSLLKKYLGSLLTFLLLFLFLLTAVQPMNVV